MKRWLIRSLFLGLLLLCVGGWVAIHWGNWPTLLGNNAGWVFNRYEAHIRTYVGNITNGRIQPDAQGEYPILNILREYGVDRVWRNGNCIVINFANMPPDGIWQLWYCPDGFTPLPKTLEDIKASRRSPELFRIKVLRPDWADCEWDD